MGRYELSISLICFKNNNKCHQPNLGLGLVLTFAKVLLVLSHLTRDSNPSRLI